MTTARKAPARKATKKTPAKAEPSPIEQRVTAFDALRERARGSRLNVATPVATQAPFALGPEDGFDPPLIIEWPASLPKRVALELTSRHGQVVGFMQNLLPEQDFVRVIAMLAPYPDADRLLIGLYLQILEHFFGPGAGDVPGGTPASSTP
ncbi:hypothetical protein ACIBQ0_17235 [Nocardia nova]|uniref:hypothetical protein n=1 Tax=Nocardia nova TaxID=37330 RepID=UPI0037AFA3AB